METRPYFGDSANSTGSDRLLLRRLGAGATDLGLILATGLIVIMAVYERFTIGPDVNGNPVVSPLDQGRLNEMRGALSRAYEFNDFLIVFSTTSVLAVAAAVVIAALVIGVVVPTLTKGQSVGKMIFGLRVVGIDGSSPPPSRHFIRTAAGIADLMPLVVPGLTGFAFAASNPSFQRIGDRVANTVVVDTGRSSRRPTIVRSTDVAAPHPAFTDAFASNKLNPRRQRPDQVVDGSSVSSTPTQTSAVQTGKPLTDASRTEGYGELIEMSDNVNAGQQRPVAPPGARRVPVEERPTNPYPKPARREAAPVAEQPEAPGEYQPTQLQPAAVEPLAAEPIAAEPFAAAQTDHDEADGDELGPDGYDALALPESSLSDMPLTNSALFEALGLSPEAIAQLESDLAEPGPEPRPAYASEQPPVRHMPAEPTTAASPFAPADHNEVPAALRAPTQPTEVPEAVRPSADQPEVPAALQPRTQPADSAPEIASASQPITADDEYRRSTPTNLNPPPPMSSSEAHRNRTEPARKLPERIHQVAPEPAPVAYEEPAPQQPLNQRPIQPIEPVEPAPIEQTASQPMAVDPAPTTAEPATSSVAIASDDVATQDAAQPQQQQASAPAADQRAPIWSDDWEAWIYWDTTLRTWFRHDEVSGNWVPMDED